MCAARRISRSWSSWSATYSRSGASLNLRSSLSPSSPADEPVRLPEFAVVPTILRSTKVVVAAAVALIVVVAAVLVIRDRSGQSGQVAQYVVPDTAGKATGQ